MPPRNSPPPSGKPRRRPAPAMPGGGFLLVLMLIALLGILYFSSNSDTVQYGAFKRMLQKDEEVKNIKKIAIAADHITVEVEDKDKLPPEIAEHVTASKSPFRFTTKPW